MRAGAEVSMEDWSRGLGFRTGDEDWILKTLSLNKDHSTTQNNPPNAFVMTSTSIRSDILLDHAFFFDEDRSCGGIENAQHS